MIKKTKKRIAILCAALAVIAFGAGAGFSVYAAQPVQAELVENVVRTTYTKGEELVLPASVSIAGENGAVIETTERYLVCPDGRAYTSDKFILTDCGQYKVVFETKVDGVRYVAEKAFVVEQGIFSVEMPTSSFTYGALNDNFNTPWKYYNGILAELADGDRLTYHKPFNIYEEDTANMFIYNVMTWGTDLSVGTISIRLTDCYNPDNYMDIYDMHLYKNEQYFRAGISGQASVGLYHAGPKTGDVTIDGVTTGYFVNLNGTMLPTNYDQATVGEGKTPYYNNLRLSLDTTNRDRIRVYGETDQYSFNRLITEFNNDVMYPYYWDGFTTGDVYFSISVSGLSRTTAPLQIARIMSDYGDALKPVVDDKAVVEEDTTPPTILLDRDSTSATVVKGIPVQVPTATARDISGVAGNVKCSVYYGYGTAFQTSVPVQNGSFTPTSFGDYTVVYKAYDVYGNVATSTYTYLSAVEGDCGIEFTAPSFTNLRAGDYIRLGGYTASGYNGKVSVSVALKDVAGNLMTYEETTPILLSQAGTYVAVYTYKDAAYNYTEEIEFVVADEGHVGFIDTMAMPNYFIKGASYTLEGGEAFRYTANLPEKVAVKCYANFDRAGYVECNADAVGILASETAQFKFVYANDESVYVETAEIPVVDVNFTDGFDIGKYFVGNFDYNATYESVVYTARAAGNLTMEFINPISLSNFYLGFQATKVNGFKGLSVQLTDYYDRTKTLTITLSKVNGKKMMTVDNNRQINLTQDYASGAIHYLNYANGAITLDSADEIPYNVDFTFDKCLMTITLLEAGVGTQLAITGIGNQAFSQIYEDTTKPMVYVETPDRVGKLGESFLVNIPAVTDVLTPVLKSDITVTVYYNSVPMTAKDGTLMNKVSDLSKTYEIEMKDYGDYLIAYNIKNSNTPHRAVVSVVDKEAPVLVVHTTHVEAKMGYAVPGIEYTVSDNITAANKLTLWHIVYNAKGVIVSVSNKEFAVFNPGEYTVVVYCEDEAGNSVVGGYTLTVK